MSDLIKFVKGNINGLEGKAILYSKLKTKKGHQLLGIYLTLNPMDIVEKFNEPLEFAEKVEKTIKKYKNCTHAFIVPIFIESEGDLMLGEEDVIFAGIYSCPKRCQEAIKSSFNLYLLRVMEQKELRIKPTQLVQLCLDKQEAIANEDYLKASEIVKEIHKIRQKS